jgi:hypothetical protein
MDAGYCVYWIHADHHADIASEGYVGVSNSAKRRFSEHLKSCQNRHLKFAIEKYGWDNLVKEVVFVSTRDACLEHERQLRPVARIGWNIMEGGGLPPQMLGPQPKLRGRVAWNKGKKMPAGMREKVRAAVLLQMQDPEHRAWLGSLRLGKPSPRKGVKLSPETIEKMRSKKIGVPSTKRGTKVTGQALENLRMAARRSWVCPHCGKCGMSVGAANRWHFDACKHRELATCLSQSLAAPALQE